MLDLVAPEYKSWGDMPYWDSQEFCFNLKDLDRLDTLPTPRLWFQAMRLTPLDKVRCVIVGQDPYPTAGIANGLAFSANTSSFPPTLRNILREWYEDLGLIMPLQGNLTPWAKQGVLLINAYPTVRLGEPASHRKYWQAFLPAVVSALNTQRRIIPYILWGGHARKVEQLIDKVHPVVSSSHPSPLSVSKSFRGSRPFSAVNKILQGLKQEPIDWSLV